MHTTATKLIVLDGDYEAIVGSNKDLFLQECTSALAVIARGVQCVDVRPGSIIVEIRGSEDAVNAAEAKVETKGLDLPSFEKLSVAGTARYGCMTHFSC